VQFLFQLSTRRTFASAAAASDQVDSGSFVSPRIRPLEAMAESVREMKAVATSILTGSDAEEAGLYFDYVIGALS
jgi:hypothetical protein